MVNTLSSMLFRMALIAVAFSAALRADEAFTVRAWAGFAPGADRRKDATLLFKGDRAAKPQRIQYILCLRDRVSEFKYMNSKGEWRGFLLQSGGIVYEPGRRRTEGRRQHGGRNARNRNKGSDPRILNTTTDGNWGRERPVWCILSEQKRKEYRKWQSTGEGFWRRSGFSRSPA